MRSSTLNKHLSTGFQSEKGAQTPDCNGGGEEEIKDEEERKDEKERKDEEEKKWRRENCGRGAKVDLEENLLEGEEDESVESDEKGVGPGESKCHLLE